jgi:hypothetical protein
MLTLLADCSRAPLPLIPTKAACVFLSEEKSPRPLEFDFEATLAQAAAKNLNNVPGLHSGDPAACCRTWICNCTRAVPHGSFL